MNASDDKTVPQRLLIEAPLGSRTSTSQSNAVPSLSLAQERILRLSRDPSKGLQTRLRMRILGVLDRTALRAALDLIIARHDVLRTTFDFRDGKPIARTASPDSGFALEEFVRDPAGPHSAIRDADAPVSFDLARGPLINGQLVQIDALEHILVVTQHAIVADTWSVGVLIRELAALYSAICAGRTDPLPPVDRQFAHFAGDEREHMSGERAKWRREYWTRALAGMPERLSLPVKGARLATTRSAMERVSVELPAELYAELQAMAHRRDIPLFVPLLCGWAVLLGRWTGQEDVVIGTRMPNRSSSQLERLIGPFENLIALRVRFDEHMTVNQLLRDVKTVIRKARSHQDMPLEEVLGECWLPPGQSRAPQVLMNVNTTPHEAIRCCDLTLQGLKITDVCIETLNSPFELSLSVDEGSEGLAGALEYASESFERETIDRLLEGWEVVLRQIVTDVHQQVVRMPIMKEEDANNIVVGFNRTDREYPLRKVIHELFEEQVRRKPEEVAAMHGKQALSYAELNDRANQLARYLRDVGIRPGDAVGIYAGRSLEMLIGVLGILKAGAAYLPLDPSYPADRLQLMIEDASPKAVLTNGDSALTATSFGVRTIDLAHKITKIDRNVAENIPQSDVGLSSENLVYVIYTSGSTGRPKGTGMRHRSVVNLIEWHRRTFGEEQGRRVLQFAALSFDVAFQEIFSTLCTGGTLVLLDEWVRRDAKALTELLISHSIERLFVPPLMLQSIAEYCKGAHRVPRSLKEVITAGEQLRVSADIRDLFRRLGGCRLHNHYGPTETHVVTALTLEGDPAAWPDLPSIGRPIANTQIYVLDGRMQPLPIGVAGEIYIGGANVARGYLSRPELTEQRFIPDPYSTDSQARLYKTGDLGRWRAEGTIEYLGRNDDQVKVRGFRVELGEIESQLARYPWVKDAAVVAREEPGGERRLVAYVTPRNERSPSVEDLRAHLKSVLPEHMVPGAFVVLDALPLTPSGKLDRRSLPLPNADSTGITDFEAPRGELEEALARIWQDLLRIERVGRQDNFFELGGHSYLIVQMMERLRRAGLSAEVRHLFRSKSLSEMTRGLTRDVRSAAIPPNGIPSSCETITPDMLPLIKLNADEIDRIVGSVPGGAANIEDIYPLAPLQKGILFHHLLDERRAQTYVLPALLEVPSRDRLEDLIAALQAVIDRHDVLRSAVVWEGLPQPVQVVYRQATLSVDEIELDPGREVIDQMKEQMRPDRQELDIGRAPMMRLRVALGKRGGPQYALLQLHHLACDHESLEALLAEIKLRMDGNEREFPSPEPYRNHIALASAQARGPDMEAFFRSKLCDIDEPTAPFGLLDVQGDGGRVAEMQQSVPSALATGIRAQARRYGVTPAVLFHVAWALVVSGTSGRDDVVFGTVLLGKLQGSAAAGHVLGMFMNSLPLRLRLDESTVCGLVKLCHAELVELVSYEQAPLAIAQQCSGISGSAPLFTTLLNYRHSSPVCAVESSDDGMESAERRMRVLEVREWTNYPISVSIDDIGSGFVTMIQTDHRIPPNRVSGYLVTALGNLVQALEQTPHKPALDVSILPDSERCQVIEGFNNTQCDYPSGKLVHELCEDSAERTPDAMAVLCNEGSLTYAELNRRSNQIAWWLRGKGVASERLVGIYMERGLDMIVALLGVLKAGAAYVPLDPSYPADRIAHILQDAAPSVVLTHTITCCGLPEIDAKVLVIDRESLEIATYQTGNPARSPGLHPGSLAYAIYTSGSTGTPKGALIEHRSLANLIHWHCGTFHVGQGTRCSSVAAAGFDAMVWEVWPPLSAGATLILAPSNSADDVQELVSWWAQQSLDVSFLPTPLAEFAFSRGMINPNLRWLLVGGDRLRSRPKHLAIDIINNYGPTETSVVATSGPVLPQDEVLHIGRPIANAKVYILDRRRQPVGVGTVGEVYIGGAGVARGYLNRPQMTAERFLPDPFRPDNGARMYKTGDLACWRDDGTIEFRGRNDDQVKIRGFRIELGEIEAWLSRHPEVLEGVVQVREDAADKLALVAYVVPRRYTDGETNLSPEILRAHLRSALPEYMVPSAFVFMERLPLTPNGKLDRGALAAPQAQAYTSGQYEAPEGAVEEVLARIWQEVLSSDRVGRHDNFFDLGGNSLTATQVMARVRTEFLVKAPMSALFECQGLKDLAARIDRLRSERLQGDIDIDDEKARKLFEMVSSMSESEAQRLLRELAGGARA